MWVAGRVLVVRDTGERDARCEPKHSGNYVVVHRAGRENLLGMLFSAESGFPVLVGGHNWHCGVPGGNDQ